MGLLRLYDFPCVSKNTIPRIAYPYVVLGNCPPRYPSCVFRNCSAASFAPFCSPFQFFGGGFSPSGMFHLFVCPLAACPFSETICPAILAFRFYLLCSCISGVPACLVWRCNLFRGCTCICLYFVFLLHEMFFSI